MEQHDNAAWVVGADLDRSCVTGLIPGDIVLCEMNGARVFSTLAHPVAAEEPWVVASNAKGSVALRHHGRGHLLTLPYSTLLEAAPQEPAVFLIKDKTLSPGPIYVVLQFAQYRIPWGDVCRAFPVPADPATAFRAERGKAVDELVTAIATFAHPGWGYRSVCRFALRSNVRAKTIAAFKEKDWATISRQPDETIGKMARELHWIPHLIAQGGGNDPAQALADAPYEPPNG